MSNQEVYDLIACFDRSTVQTLRLSTQDFTIELSRCGAAVSAADAGPAEVHAPVKKEQVSRDGEEISAPLVGIFYAAPAPGKAPFVAVGDAVKKGQTVCLIEAMKMMTEIPAPCDGTITEILKSSGDLTAFGEPLFRMQPC